ncbi:MAG: hypothetical protein ACRERX_19420 [Pseudomonas sp.]
MTTQLANGAVCLIECPGPLEAPALVTVLQDRFLAGRCLTIRRRPEFVGYHGNARVPRCIFFSVPVVAQLPQLSGDFSPMPEQLVDRFLADAFHFASGFFELADFRSVCFEYRRHFEPLELVAARYPNEGSSRIKTA